MTVQIDAALETLSINISITSSLYSDIFTIYTTQDTHTDGICSMITLHCTSITIITTILIILIWLIAVGFPAIKSSMIL